MSKTNPFNDEAMLERVEAAATALATMVAAHGKPLRLDLDTYMQMIVLSPEDGMMTDAQWAQIEDPSELTVETAQAAIDMVRGLDGKHRKYVEFTGQFAEALADAFTCEDVCDIQPCLLVEEGRTEASDGQGGFIHINSWYVIPTPTVAVNLF